MLSAVKRSEKEHETQRSGVAQSVVAFGGQVTESEIPEGSIGYRWEFVTGQCHRSLVSCGSCTAGVTAVVFICSNVPVGGRNGATGSGQDCSL